MALKLFSIQVPKVMLDCANGFNGSQQTFDLIGKALLNEGDDIVLESPGYIGAIQSFALFQPTMNTVSLNEDGLNVDQLSEVLPNSSFYELVPEKTLLLGTFSKIVVPSFRLGWIVAPDWLMGPLTVAKQAADLHTNYFSQQVIAKYLLDNSLDEHIETISKLYGDQKKVMIDAIDEYFPDDVQVAHSEGGMFIWLTVPKHISSLDLFDKAIENKVAFVPGIPFYVGEPETNTMRLSFVTVNKEKIREGIKRLGQCIKEMSV